MVGDSGVGKSCLLRCFARANRFGRTADYYVPSVCDNLCLDVKVRSATVTLNLWDTGGGHDSYSAGKRRAAYDRCDVALVCFSLADPDSFGKTTSCSGIPCTLLSFRPENVRSRWQMELMKADSRDMKTVLVGTMADRVDPNRVCSEEAANVAGEIGAVAYVECSATTQDGVRKVFEEAIR